MSHGGAVVNEKDTSNDRDTGHLYEHFIWFQKEIKRKCITNMSCTFWVVHDSMKFQFVPCDRYYLSNTNTWKVEPYVT